MKGQYLKLTWVEPGVGIRFLVAKVIIGKGPTPKRVVYPEREDPCTESGFALYVAGRGNELRLRAPTESKRRMRRFLRDYIRRQGGSTWSVNFWRTPWR